MVGQVDNGLLVCGCQIFDDEFVIIGESVLNGYIQFARITFFTIRRDTMQSQRARTHLTCFPYFGIEAFLTTVQMVRTVVECQLVFLTVQCELSLTDTVTPATNQCREVRLIAAGQLLNTIVTLNDVSNVTILIGNHDSHNGTTIVRDGYLIAFTVTEDVQVGLLTVDSGLEVFSLQTTQIRIFCCCHN